MQYPTKKEEEAFALDTRRDIYHIVKQNAGCHFREIERRSGLSTGSIQYHLAYLVKRGVVKLEKDGKNVRYYPKSTSATNKKLLTLLRQKSIRDILLYLLTNKKGNHKDFVAHTALSASTVSWHLRRLSDEDVVGFVKKGRHVEYSLLVDKEELAALLVTYKESFFDSLVDRVVEMWE